ncbi:hypothetical protein [Labrenzia sp. THAF82]|nr:hypothetical protein [Labrenzia sp. THAF82]
MPLPDDPSFWMAHANHGLSPDHDHDGQMLPNDQELPIAGALVID